MAAGDLFLNLLLKVTCSKNCVPQWRAFPLVAPPSVI